VPIVLVPEPTRKWIIARASAEDMKKIAEWIEKLDKKEQIQREYETVQLGYADVSEVAQRLNEAIQEMPGSELQQSVLIQPLTQASQIMIFGREDLREMVKKMIAEIDIPSGMFETRVFELKYADADKVKENLEGLYEQEAGYSYGYSYSSRGYNRSSRNVETKETVRVIAFSTMHQVTVIASPENMLKIADQIAEWDVPLDLEQVKPRILTLQNSDPVQMTDLLKTLFSEQSDSGRNMFSRFFFGDEMEEREKIVGPLYGQLTFEEVPGTKKIIVISNVAGAYDVIEDLVAELDSQDMAEVPQVIELKYADPEDLSERLNALFVEAGQQAVIRRTEEGLSAESQMDTADDGSSSNNTSQQQTRRPQRDRQRNAHKQRHRKGPLRARAAHQVDIDTGAAGIHGRHQSYDQRIRHARQAGGHRGGNRGDRAQQDDFSRCRAGDESRRIRFIERQCHHRSRQSHAFRDPRHCCRNNIARCGVGCIRNIGNGARDRNGYLRLD